MKTKQFDPKMPARGGGSAAALPVTEGRIPDHEGSGSAVATVTLELSWSVWVRLATLATQRGTDIRRLALDLLELAVADGNSSMAVPTTSGGYRWKDLTLPAGTELSFKHRGVTYIALVTNGSVVHDGRQVSPSKFINAIAGPGRNAWVGLWVRRPSDPAWLLADELRRLAEMQQMANHVMALNAVRMAAADTNGPSPPSNPASSGMSSPAPPDFPDPSSPTLSRPRRRRRRLVTASLA